MILVTDVDFQKDKDKKPIGLPILGPVPYKLLEQAGFSQPTASLYQGKRTYQFFGRGKTVLKYCLIPA